MPIRSTLIAATAFVFGLAPTFVAATTEITPLKAIAAESEVSGEVTVVNTESRMLTIRKPDGVFEVLHAPPEVERLADIKIGDKLTVTKAVMAVIELEQGRDAGAMGMMADTQVQRDAGSAPGGSITDTVTIFGQVVGVDRGAGTVTIKGPNSTETFEVEDKARLTELNVKQGDGVIVRMRNVISGQIKR
jgi:hypothetical protein